MYAQLMLKYFAAEAIVTGQALTFVSADQDPHKIIKVKIESSGCRCFKLHIGRSFIKVLQYGFTFS